MPSYHIYLFVEAESNREAGKIFQLELRNTRFANDEFFVVDTERGTEACIVLPGLAEPIERHIDAELTDRDSLAPTRVDDEGSVGDSENVEDDTPSP